MVLAIEMGVVFVLLTAILMALYVAWQNAKFVGDRLRKKQVMKRLVAGGAAIVLAVAVAIGAVVPAYAATSDTDTKQNEQTETATGDYDTSTVYQWGSDDFLTLPKAEEKNGYLFRGYSLNGDTKLVQAGETVKIESGEKATTVRPIYTSTRYERFTNAIWTVGWICTGIGLLMLALAFVKPNTRLFRVGIYLSCTSLIVVCLVSNIIKTVFDARFLDAALAAIN